MTVIDINEWEQFRMISINVSNVRFPVKLIEDKRAEAQDLLASLGDGAFDDTGWIGFPN